MNSLSKIVDRKFVNSIELLDFEIDTDTGWQPVIAIHKTIPYSKWTVKTESGCVLDAADTHIVFDENMNEVFIKDLIINESLICTKTGIELVTELTESSTTEHMFDVSVNSKDHRFYSNGILSHNTTIGNSLSYGLFGQALTNIRKDNLINNINGKSMLVTVSFEKDGINYHIERGRKPTLLKFSINGQELKSADQDESQGDSRETQKAIEDVLSMSHDMFKHIVALNTYTEPFLSMKSADQRNIIEQLLGMTQLSMKADSLKELIRQSKDAITAETIKIDTIKSANDRINQSIDTLERKEKMWYGQKEQSLATLLESIEVLATIDADQEIILQRELIQWNTKKTARAAVNVALAKSTATIEREQTVVSRLVKELTILADHKCYSCGQDVHDEQHESLINSKTHQHTQGLKTINTLINEIQELTDSLLDLGDETATPRVTYDSLEEALNHKNTLNMLVHNLTSKEAESNPYTEQIADLRNTALQKITWDSVNTLTTIKDHQEFLHKLLTNKDSFVRKRIIDQNLLHLNQRLTYYLNKIGLPHQVEFQNDLSVNITQLGQDLDFDNLSRGERNRLILSMSWSFRDVWENLYHPINLLFIDELVDSGMDASGVESSISILKQFTRDRNKSVFLISHRDDLTNRVNRVLTVTKENGFTSYSEDVEIT